MKDYKEKKRIKFINDGFFTFVCTVFIERWGPNVKNINVEKLWINNNGMLNNYLKRLKY